MLVQSRRNIVLGAGAALFAPNAFAQTSDLSFLVVGDWGEGSDEQRRVAGAMAGVAGRSNSRFVISTGDNFYPRGVGSVSDPQFRSSFEEIYSAPSLQTPWYVVLGNHDYEGSPNAEVAYSARSPRWRMPSRYWSQAMPVGGEMATFYFLDTTPIARLGNAAAHVPMLGTSSEARTQLQWFEETLAADQSRWKVVVGHHPILSSGNHGETPAVVERVKPLLERYGVHVYLNGHEHDLEHLVENDVHYVCSGSGAHARQIETVAQSRFAYADIGFASCGLAPEALTLRFHNTDAAVIYETQIAPA
ncbi:MAG: tartrate-resistant acid phosphatase type 5 family protein [Alphaproteobacteria bacterium]|nr:tartrate-resistant acid phosphatase type 5 family protein [Alphaproteobacteria bacterium]